MATSIAIFTLTQQGIELAQKLTASLDGRATLFATRRHAEGTDATPFDSLADCVSTNFTHFDGHIFIAAAGIVIRTIGPLMQDKTTDPAVVCLDQQGRFAVSLLSGHLGGGNALAEQCATILDGQAVITTATDSAGVPSLDMLAAENNMTIGNIDRVKVVNGALLDKRAVQIFDQDNLLGLQGDTRFIDVANKDQWTMGAPGVWISYKDDCPDADALWLYPRVLMLGVGCRRGVPGDEIFNHIRNVFDAAGFSLDAIGGLASVDLKADEVGLLETAAHLGVEPTFYDKQRLDSVEAPNPSGAVMRRVGIQSVAEASALLLSDKGELLVEKTKTKTVTLAIARRLKRT
jgi:cobalt-precorrin 5A hydrolase